MTRILTPLTIILDSIRAAARSSEFCNQKWLEATDRTRPTLLNCACKNGRRKIHRSRNSYRFLVVDRGSTGSTCRDNYCEINELTIWQTTWNSGRHDEASPRAERGLDAIPASHS